MNSSKNPKAIQTYYDLDIARCNEKWVDIPELARRYKKYSPYESVLEFTARMEAEFVLLVRQIRQEKYQAIKDTLILQQQQSSSSDINLSIPASPPGSPVPTSRKWGNRQLINHTSGSVTNLNTAPTIRKSYPEESDFIYQLDDPNNVSMHLPLLPSQVQLILVRLLDVIQRQIKSVELETPDDWQAQFSKIILARIYFETNRYDKTLEWLQQLALKMEDVETGYGLVLLVQARVMKGVCYESMDQHQDALDSYLSALQVVEQHPHEQNKALCYWIEGCLYRSILLQLRKKGPVKQTLKLMRTYLHYCITQWPSNWRIHKRWVIFRHYIRYLTRAYQKGVYMPATPQDEYIAPMSGTRSVFSEAGETTLFERSVAALDETMQLMTQFRNLLATFAPLLIKSNPVDLSHRTLELSNLLVSAHDTVGWGPPEYIKRMFKYLNRSRKFTFNSLCTTRHIFYTSLRLGESAEAKLALNCYLELLGVPNLVDIQENEDEDQIEELVDTLQNRLEYINEQSTLSASKNLYDIELKLNKLRHMDDDNYSSSEEEESDLSSAPKKKTPTGSCENDNEFDVVRLLMAATQQLYAEKGQEAAILMDVAVCLLDESEGLKRKKGSQWKQLMAVCRRYRGIAYGTFASHCHDAEKRLEYHTESLISLQRATEMDSRSWQAFYQFGLQQAVMGDMPSAATSLKRAIKLRGDFIPSWHLLAIVQSSPQFHALPQSLQIIQAGLVYHMNMIENFDNEESAEFDLETEEGKEFFERAESFMYLRISQTKILEQLEGSEAVIHVYPDLLEMYSKLSKKLKLSVTVVLETPPRRSSLHESSIKGRPRSRTNSSIHSNGSSSYFDDEESSLHNENSSDIRTPVLKKVEENEDEDLEDEYFDSKTDKKKSESKNASRKSDNLMRTLADDPLLSFPVVKKKEKKEKPAKKSTFLSLKPSFRSSDSSKKSKELEAPLPLPQNELLSPSFTIPTRTDSSISRHTSTSAVSVKSSTQQSQRQASYSSLLSSSTTDLTNTIETPKESGRQQRWQTILVQIWIMASATYAKTHRFDDAFKAIYEADQLTRVHSADVWYQIGSIIVTEYQMLNKTKKKSDGQLERALDAFKKALSIDAEHVATHIAMATVFLELEQVELAEQLLERATQGLGWNQTETWYLLSQVYKQQGNMEDAKNSLLYALQLSETQPTISLNILPRFV